MTTKPGHWVAVAALAGWLLAGCRGDTAEMSPSAAQTLQRDVASVVEAARASHWDAAAAALQQLSHDVARAQAAGELSADRASRILAASERVAEDLEKMPEPRPTARPPAGGDDGGAEERQEPEQEKGAEEDRKEGGEEKGKGGKEDKEGKEEDKEDKDEQD